MSCDMCHVSGVCLPSRLSKIGAVTEAGEQITLAAFLSEQKLNYLNMLNYIDINTIEDTIHNEIIFIRLDKKSEKSWSVSTISKQATVELMCKGAVLGRLHNRTILNGALVGQPE